MNRRRRVLLLVLIALIVGVSLFVVAATLPAHDASSFLRDATELKMGEASFDQVRVLARNYHGRVLPVGGAASPCSAAYCLYTFVIENNLLYRVGLAPHMGMIGRLEVANDVLISRYIALVFQGRGPYLEVFANEKVRWPSEQPIRVVQRTGDLPSMGVELTPEAAPDQRQLAYDLNTGCLKKIHGCKDAAQALPALKLLGPVAIEAPFLHTKNQVQPR